MAKSIKLNRSKLEIKPNQIVLHDNEEFKILQVSNSKEIAALSLKTNKIKTLLIHKLQHTSNKETESITPASKDTSDITTKEWEIAMKRLKDIDPIIKNETSSTITKHAQKIGIHQSTLYRWFNSYQEAGGVSGLLPRKEGRKEGTTMIDPEAEKVIQQVVEEYYLTSQKPKKEAVIRQVASRCMDLGIKIPGKNTIRRRINTVSEFARLAAHSGKSIAQDKFRPAPNHYEANYPLEVVQIDHTPVDLILVDKENRQPIGRPWITLAIDINSRMIHGYYLSFDAPSATSVAMCIVNAVQSKDKLLSTLGVDAEWDIWGFMDTIHVDNGADFRSEALMRGCELHGIDLNYRPVGKSYFGGHIERVIGTFMKEVHNIPGTTFSNIKEKGKYDPDKQSVMTFEEFEKWLVTFITTIYHKNKHQTIKMSPEKKFHQGIWGTKQSPGKGLPPKASNEETILLDFLPLFKRTIQKNGINIDGINYYDSVLRSFISSTDKNKKDKKKFIIKRDPRDISHVWFYDESVQEYFKIPYANTSIPAMTAGEWLELKKQLKKLSGNNKIYDADIIRGYDEMHAQIRDAEKLTKKVRRKKEKKRVSTIKKEGVVNSIPVNSSIEKDSTLDNENDDLWDDTDIPDFDVE